MAPLLNSKEGLILRITVMLSKSIKALIISSLITFSLPAHADAASIIGILFKIYEAASAKANNPKQPQKSPQTVQPENFIRGTGDNITNNGSNLNSNEQKIVSSSNDLPNNQNARMNENGTIEVDYLTEQDKIDNDSIYLEEFNARKLSNAQFKKLYYGRCFGCAFIRNNVTLANATDKEKITLEKSLQKKVEQATRAKKYSIAFKVHVYKVIQLMSLSFVELKELRDSQSTQNKEFNLDPANDALHIKSWYKNGILFYEYNHQELGTHCLWGIGGNSEYISDCDKLFALQMKEYKIHHRLTTTKLTNKEIKEIAYQINPH